MALSDPTYGVPTPTGVLQGVAAFNYDGSQWQPAGLAGPCVATPTGVLRGVAAFNDGAPWQPAGLAGPSVATPTGVLEGVAVYTWSGSAWVPPGGQPSPSTPTGALRGVAAFDWDGSQWQPAGQAGPDVATPYGVLQGVARFNWTGSAWAAVGAPSFERDFTSGGLGTGAVFTRASAGWAYGPTGVLTSFAANVPRFDYDPVTLQPKGLLLEDTSTNICLQSGNLAAAGWGFAGNTAVIAATPNQAIAPDGTLTAALLVYPAVPANGQAVWFQAITTAAQSYAFSVWLKGSVGGELVSLIGAGGVPIGGNAPFVLTTHNWQRFSYITATAASSCRPAISKLALIWTRVFPVRFQPPRKPSTPGARRSKLSATSRAISRPRRRP